MRRRPLRLASVVLGFCFLIVVLLLLSSLYASSLPHPILGSSPVPIFGDLDASLLVPDTEDNPYVLSLKGCCLTFRPVRATLPTEEMAETIKNLPPNPKVAPNNLNFYGLFADA
jgi:hypothetical protein